MFVDLQVVVRFVRIVKPIVRIVQPLKNKNVTFAMLSA